MALAFDSSFPPVQTLGGSGFTLLGSVTHRLSSWLLNLAKSEQAVGE